MQGVRCDQVDPPPEDLLEIAFDVNEVEQPDLAVELDEKILELHNQSNATGIDAPFGWPDEVVCSL